MDKPFEAKINRITRILAGEEAVPPRPEWTQAYVRECFDYNPDTGALTWKRRPDSHFKRPTGQGLVGEQAGAIDARYGFRLVRLDGHLVTITRIIWLWVDGSWVENTRHRNGARDDNRLSNLEKVPRQHRGAVRYRGRWLARAQVKGVQHRFGTFDTPEAAHAAYLLGLATLSLRDTVGGGNI